MITDIQLTYTEEGESLRDAVYHTLKRSIMTGVLVTDDRLMEIPIANQLGVSRTPVREAIQRLEKEQLVVVSPRCGAKVAGITDKEVKDALDVRIGVERMSVGMAAENITKEQIAGLRELNSKIRYAIIDEDVLRISDLDNLLHRRICESSGNNVLMDIMRQLEDHVLRYRFEYIKSIKGNFAIYEEHERIISAIERKDVQAAGEHMMEHIRCQKEQICKLFTKK